MPDFRPESLDALNAVLDCIADDLPEDHPAADPGNWRARLLRSESSGSGPLLLFSLSMDKAHPALSDLPDFELVPGSGFFDAGGYCLAQGLEPAEDSRPFHLSASPEELDRARAALLSRPEAQRLGLDRAALPAEPRARGRI